MLSPSDVITANEQQVAAKVMEGEAILINLTTGAYYSTPSTGGFIWSLVERRLSIGEMVCAVTEHYDVARPRAEADVLRLCEELCAEGLALALAGVGRGVAPKAAGARLPYEAPALEKYTDMAEMFALDPPLPGLSKVINGN
ncbi:MAG TPA: PqqD family protein [Pseudomonadales bacterium]